MNADLMLDAISNLDDDLIEKHFKTKESLKSKKRYTQKLRYSILVASISIVMVIAVLIELNYVYPKIDFNNNAQNVSARYIPKWMAVETNQLLPYYTESELFERAEYIFTGTVSNIEHIMIDFDGNRVYKSIITIDVETSFKGDCHSQIKVMAPAIGVKEVSTNNKMLYELEKGACGVFLADEITDGEVIVENECEFDISKLCDAKFDDGLRFGFLRDTSSTRALCCDTLSVNDDAESKVFSSLDSYEWNDIIAYVKKMIEDHKGGS